MASSKNLHFTPPPPCVIVRHHDPPSEQKMTSSWPVATPPPPLELSFFPDLYCLRGRVVHPDFFVKLDFEIAVDQQIRANDQTFEGVPDSGCRSVPAGQPRPYLVNFCQITLTCSQPCFGCSTCSY